MVEKINEKIGREGGIGRVKGEVRVRVPVPVTRVTVRV